MTHLRAWVVAWIVLWWGFLLLAGDWNRIEWIAAASAATIAASLGEVARVRAGVHARVPLRLLTTGGSAFLQVFVDFGILMRVLLLSALRRRVVRGAFRSHELAETGDDAASVGARVWRTLLADYSPNAYVVELEPERGLVLLHDLVPNRSSEEPA